MEACRDLCLTAPYRCHSFDYGDTGQRVCRLSHHTSVTLTQIQVGTQSTLTTNNINAMLKYDNVTTSYNLMSLYLSKLGTIFGDRRCCGNL